LPKSKLERLEEMMKRLRAAAPFCDGSQARAVLEQVMRAVEDEHSGIPENPLAATSPDPTDGRMYPPDDSFEKPSGSARVRLFRHRRHSTYIGANGSLRIIRASGTIELDLPGTDGKSVGELLEHDHESH
jgi:hypothetical protein